MEKQEFFRRARTDLPGPLAGMRVLDATTTLAGPLCTSILGDFGADVIKVESPQGDISRRAPPFLPGTEGLSFGHATINRNKRSLILDLHHERGREIFLRLAERADLLVENFRPGVMDRWGLGYDQVRARKSDVIYVSVSGFGQFGPDAERPAYDPLAQAMSGFLSWNGEPGGTPVKAAIALADHLAALHATIAALGAWAHRERTGEGQHVDVSLLDSMLYESDGALTLAALGAPIERLGNEFVFATPANCYRCSDGHVYVGVLLDAQWQGLARAMGRPELADDPGFGELLPRLERRADVNRIVADWCAGLACDEVVSRCAAERVPAAPVRTYADAASDAHTKARDMLQDVTLEDGTVAPIPGPVAKLSRTPLAVRRGAPALGADTEEILAEIGISAEDQKALREQGVI